MRLRNELRRIAKQLTDSPNQEDLASAQQAILDLLDERTRLSSRIMRLTNLAKEKQPTKSPKTMFGWLRWRSK